MLGEYFHSKLLPRRISYDKGNLIDILIFDTYRLKGRIE